VGGSISALVTLCFSLSFAAMIFAGELARDLSFGIRMALTSAAITVIGVALLSPFRFAIAGPDSRSAAVQSALAATVVAALQGRALATPVVLLALSLSTALTGTVLYVCGKMKMGSWIRYVPYPVVGGFLASTGWMLIVGAFRVITGRQVTWSTLPELLHRPTLGYLLTGLGFTALLQGVLSRTKHFLALPSLLVAGTLLVHIVRALSGVSVIQAQKQGWLLAVPSQGRLWLPLRDLPWHALADSGVLHAAHLVWQYAGGVLVLIAVSAIAILITGAAIEVATRSDADLDQELISHGIANLVSGLFGGLVGQNAIARSLVNRQAGGLSRVSGVFAGLLCLIVDILQPGLAGLLARPIMGATLAFLGLRLLDEWVIKARSHLERLDYLLVLSILLVIARFGFVAGLLFGLVISCLIFAVNYARVSVIKSSFTMDELTSKVQRSTEECAFIREHGNRQWVLRLRGYLFFGSMVHLLQDIRERIHFARYINQPLQTLVLDFSAVIGIDSSAVLMLAELRPVAEQNSMQLIFSALQSGPTTILRREGCLRNDGICVELSDVESALEFCEQKMLEQRSVGALNRHSFPAQLAKALGSEQAATRLLTYTERLTLAPNEYLLHQGDPSDAIYILVSGRVGILLEMPEGPPLRLRSVASNTTLGEVGLYRKKPRSTSVVAEVPTVIIRLGQSALSRMEDEEPQLALAFHTYIIRVLSDRLISSDKAISALER
jgi:SulP family sulfate permease